MIYDKRNKKQNRTCPVYCGNRGSLIVWNDGCFQCHAYHGGVSASQLLHYLGSNLRSVFITGLFSIKKTVTQHRKTLLLLVMMGAYVFVLSALKIPSVTGSSSHPTGTGLGAILFGPTAMCVIGVIVLLFQALLLAHGGLTTLGANTFSMAIAGPFLAFGVFLICKKLHAPKSLGVFLAACLGDLFTYCITSVQLALAHPSQVGGFAASLAEFMGIFAVTQIPLAVIEGLIAVVVMKALESYAKPELTELGYLGV